MGLALFGSVAYASADTSASDSRIYLIVFSLILLPPDVLGIDVCSIACL